MFTVKFIYSGLFFLFTTISLPSAAEDRFPSINSISIPAIIPPDVVGVVDNMMDEIIANYSKNHPLKIDPKKSLVWVQNSHHHYFLQIQDQGACSIIDVDQEAKNYRDMGTLPYCKILEKPHVVDWTDNGVPGISIKIRTRRSSEDFEHDIFLAYLYVPEKSKFCRNADAESFATGFRVPNSVRKFKASDCE